MRQKRAYLVMLGVLAATVLIGLAGFYLGEQRLAKRAASIADLKADQQIAQQQIEIYKETEAKVEELSFVKELADDVLPQEKAQAAAVAQLQVLARESGVGVQTISFGGSSDPKSPELSQTNAVDGVTGVRTFQVTLSLETGSTYKEFLNFLQKLERNRRKMQVTSLAITPDSNNRNILSSANLSINVYLRG